MSVAPWIQVAPNGRYLQYSDGKPFFSIGHGEAFGFFFQKMNPHATLRDFLAHMRETGQNTLLCQVENEDLDFYGGHRLSLEGPLGHYHEPVAKQFDELLELARDNGIYVITYLWDTFHMDFNWQKSPYHVANGGPCTYVSDMLRDPVARDWQKAKFKWAIDRWGHHPNLLAWELMNEIEWAVAGPIPGNELVGGASHPDEVAMTNPITHQPGRFRLATDQEMSDWVTDMGCFTRAYALERWGRAHLQTVSTNRPTYEAAWFYGHDEIDFVTNHQYFWDEQMTTNPSHPMQAAMAVVGGVRNALTRVGYQKPYMDTESGPLGWHLENPADYFPLDDAAFHAMSWANWASGAAGGGLRWPYPNYGFGGKPYLNPLSSVMEQTLLAMARVSAHVDWNRFDSRPGEQALTVSEPALRLVAVKDERQAIAWLVHDSRHGDRPAAPASLSLTGFTAGAYRLLWLDPRTGALLGEATRHGTGFEVLSPAFSSDLVLVVKPE